MAKDQSCTDDVCKQALQDHGAEPQTQTCQGSWEAHVEAGMNAESDPEEPVVHVMAPSEIKVESDTEEPDVHVMPPRVNGKKEEREASEENPCVTAFEIRKRSGRQCLCYKMASWKQLPLGSDDGEGRDRKAVIRDLGEDLHVGEPKVA